MTSGDRTAGYSIRGLTWASYSGIFVFGIVLAILGVLLPLLFERIDLDPVQAGSLFWFLNLGSLIVSLGSGLVFDRFGFKLVLVLASLSAGAALTGMAWATSYPMMATGIFFLGLGGGGLNAGTNVLMADLYPNQQASALNRLGIFFGFGACFIPLFIGGLIAVLDLGTILLLTGVIALVPGAAFLRLAFPPGKHAEAGLPRSEVKALLLHPFVLLMGALLFFQSGNEFSTGGWMTSYLVETLAFTASTASFYLSGFWAALIVGRVLSVRLLRRMAEETLVQLSAASAALALLLFILVPHPWVSLLAMCWLGLSMAPIFPSALGEAAKHFPHLSGTVFGILIATALVGGMTIPWLLGFIVRERSLAAGLFVPVFGFVMVALLQTVIKARFGKQQPQSR
jgi:fucose permease